MEQEITKQRAEEIVGGVVKTLKSEYDIEMELTSDFECFGDVSVKIKVSPKMRGQELEDTLEKFEDKFPDLLGFVVLGGCEYSTNKAGILTGEHTLVMLKN